MCYNITSGHVIVSDRQLSEEVTVVTWSVGEQEYRMKQIPI